MANASPADPLETFIEPWRRHVRSGPDIAPTELAALEFRLRTEFAALSRAGLAPDEAFLIAVQRTARDPRGSPAAQEFARASAGRVWPPFAATTVPVETAGLRAPAHRDALVAFGFAVLAGIAIKVPALFGINPTDDAAEHFYFRNASLLVLPCLIGFFLWKRQFALGTKGWLALLGTFGAAALFANLPGFGGINTFGELTALHLPIALWLAVGIVHAGGRWRETAARMDFIRFSGELFIHYVLIALGGGVFCALMAVTFKSIGIDIGPFFGAWLIPCGATGALIVASWLVESKRGVRESLAPMLTRLFAPLFALMLVAFLGTLLLSGRGIDLERAQLIGFDLLLVVVLALLIYAISARDPHAPPGAFDLVLVVLVVGALLADIVALWAIGARIGEFGFSPNRVAALGENLILLVNLAWSAVLYVRFLLGRGAFSSLERWQTGYLPVYSVWAALVVVAFPPLFRWLG